MYKLLIADDEAVEREAIKFFIKGADLEFESIEEAANGLQAVKIAKEILPDIAVLDIRMPGKDGLEAAKEIQQSGSDCRFIFLTAFNEFEYAHQAIKVKADDFIIKPANGDDLIVVLRKVIADLDRKKISFNKSKALETRASLFTTWFENDLMLSVAKGYMPESRLKDYFERMDILFVDAICAIIHIRQHTGRDRAKLSQKSLMQRAIGIVDKLCVEKGIRHLFGVTGSCIYMMAMTYDGWWEFHKSQELFAQISRAIQHKMDVDIQIGIGKPFQNTKEASSSFFQAKFAYRSKKSSEPMASFAYVERQKENIKYPLKEEKKLCENIVRGDQIAAEKYVEVLMDWISQFSGSMELIKGKVHELVTIVDRAVIQEFSVKSVLIQDRLVELGRLQSMNEIIIFFKNIVSEIVIRINSLKNSPSVQLVDRACDYIDQNYYKDIKLEEIGTMLGFSKCYFSKMFKQYKNINFVDYITLRRVDKAKELLSNLRLSVKEISAEVGYKDPNYFTNVFKKREGISPTEYRNKHLGSGRRTKYQMWKSNEH